MENRFDNSASWVILSPIEQSIKRKIESIGVPLKDWDISINYGIKTGFNEAFIIDGKKKAELISADPKSAEIIRPILRGRDITRYSFEFADLYIIATFPSKMYNIDDYPAVKEYLLSFGMGRLEQTGKVYHLDGTTIKARKKTTNKWFETQDSISYWDDFSRQKIVWKRVGSILRFGYDNLGHYSLDSTCFLTGSHLKFLTLLLNSPMGKYLLKDSPRTGTGDLLVSVQAVEPILIPQISPEDETIFDDYFDKINNITNHNEDIKDIELIINKRIYTLYHLNPDESLYIDEFTL